MDNSTVKQLKEECVKKGIKFSSKCKKNELIALLNNSNLKINESSSNNVDKQIDKIELKINESSSNNVDKTESIIHDKIYLGVPFSEKDDAKELGAKWDPIKKMWYTTAEGKKLIERWPINDKPVELIGEDRNFGGNDLFVDLIPSTCWFTNVRSCIHPSDWDRVRKYVYERVNNCCECCGVDTKKEKIQLEAHERWYYDKENETQKLMRIIALCSNCHQTTHIGLAGIKGKSDEAKQHLCKVRKFTLEECEKHIKEAFSIWNERNKFDWELDLTLITSNNIKLSNTVNKDERKHIANKTLFNKK